MEPRALANPLLNLTQTANSIIAHLETVDPATFQAAIVEVKKDYVAYADSWLWGWFTSAPRRDELDKVINSLGAAQSELTPTNTEIMNELEQSQHLILSKLELNDKKSMVDIVKELLDDNVSEAGEYSANTYLLRALLNMTGYQVKNIPLDKINELKGSLLTVINLKMLDTSIITKQSLPQSSCDKLTRDEIETALDEANRVRQTAGRYAGVEYIARMNRERKSMEQQLAAEAVKAALERKKREDEVANLCKTQVNQQVEVRKINKVAALFQQRMQESQLDLQAAKKESVPGFADFKTNREALGLKLFNLQPVNKAPSQPMQAVDKQIQEAQPHVEQPAVTYKF